MDPKITEYPDRIIIKDLLVQAVIGVNENERVKNQNIIIRIVLFTNFDRVSRSDNIDDTVNYSYNTILLFSSLIINVE
jgi:FolB domain-containing protein